MSKFVQELRELNIPIEIIDKLTHHFNCVSIYIPKPDSKSQDEKSQRNSKIYQEFTAKNSSPLRKKYNLSVS